MGSWVDSTSRFIRPTRVIRSSRIRSSKSGKAFSGAGRQPPAIEPGADWERTGQVPNVVFAEGLVVEPARWLVYYGGAEKYVGVAAINVRPR